MASSVSSTVTVVSLKRSLVPPRWEETVRVVGMSECREAALSLAYAFAADDYAQYLVDSGDMHGASAEDKWKLHVDILTYTVAAHCMSGLVITVGPEYDSVALWYVPLSSPSPSPSPSFTRPLIRVIRAFGEGRRRAD